VQSLVCICYPPLNPTQQLTVLLPRYQIAQIVAFEEIELSTDSLQRFLAAPRRSQLRVLETVKKLTVEDDGYYDYSARIHAATDSDYSVREFETENFHQHAQTESWRMTALMGNSEFLDLQTCGSLVSFTGYLRHMVELKTFRFKVSMKSPVNEWIDQLHAPIIVSVFNALPKSITSLTIDNPWERSGFRRRPDDYHQICCQVLSQDFLPSLRHLCLRLRSICPRVFEMNDHAAHPYLETLTVNLSLKDPVHQSEAEQSECCEEFGTIERTLFPELLDAAKNTVIRLPAIRTFRILRHVYPILRLTSYDILANKQALLPENARWDQIGDEFPDVPADDQSDVDLFDNSGSDTESSSLNAPWINLEVEATL
jgi:hypothetical protein